MYIETDRSNTLKQILLVGSSHTSLSFLYLKNNLDGRAIVSKLPEHAGNTEEMLISLPGWRLEGKDIVYVYAGHRDLMLDEMGHPVVKPEKFQENLETIINRIILKSYAKIVFSNIPPVSKIFLKCDNLRNQRIRYYNQIIEEVVSKAGIHLYNFSKFVLNHSDGLEKYSDGLHFTRKFYKVCAANLAEFLISL